ncbi:MAG: sugar phosphate isomerase/epimerase [Nakamurella sp.]
MTRDHASGETAPRKPAPTTTVPVGLSTSSVFPEGTKQAFELAAELGYDGVEVMVTADRLTQDPNRLGSFAKEYGVPVLSVHSPCLALSARVWSTDPIKKLTRSIELADATGARTVVAHPPFAWQRAAAKRFPTEVAGLAATSDVQIAIENMYPVPVLGLPISTYRPDWDVVRTGYPSYTLDLSHTSAAGVDAVDMAEAMGADLVHVHLGDGTGAARDEHLVPGRGTVRCVEVLRGLVTGEYGARGADGGFAGVVILEVSTRTVDAQQRATDLAEALAFAREHLGEA